MSRYCQLTRNDEQSPDMFLFFLVFFICWHHHQVHECYSRHINAKILFSFASFLKKEAKHYAYIVHFVAFCRLMLLCKYHSFEIILLTLY